MGFIFSEYWIWLLVLPVSVGIIYLVYKRSEGLIQTWFGPEEYARSRPALKFGLRTAALSLLMLALLGPYFGEANEDLPLMSRNIYLLLDVSASMNAEDIKPSRLDRAKRDLQALIRDLKGDNIGLILFSDNAYVQCPLTRDHHILSQFLDLAETDQFSQTGTRFRPALARAMERFGNIEDPGSPKGKAVVLMSDGEDFGDTYVSLVERLKNQKIAVFTVGIGTYAGAPVPNFQNGRKVGYKTYQDGSMAISRLVDKDLRFIADEFNTAYETISENDDDLSGLQGQLNALAASPLESNFKQVQSNQYQFFLFLSVIVLFSSLFLMPVRRI